MYGYIGTFGIGEINVLNTKVEGRKEYSKKYIENEEFGSNFVIKRKTIDRFIDDKVWVNDDDLFLGLEGTVLNKTYLIRQTKKNNLFESLKYLYSVYGANFITHIKGTFALMLLDKRKNKLYIFSSPFAYRSIYYYVNDKQILFSTDIAWIYNALKDNGISLTLDRDGAYCLLSMGYMLDNKTLVQGVSKVRSGEYIEFENGCISNIQYLDFTQNGNEYNDWEYADLLKKADDLFCSSVKDLFEKDREYGYNHFCTLSGGLDSRSIVATAYDLGFTDQLTVTFCQSGMLDAKVASNISADYHLNHITYDLDSCNCFCNVEDAVLANGGLISFHGFMAMQRICEIAYNENYGFVHTGMIGDVLFGCSYDKYDTENWDISMGAFSTKLIDKFSDDFIEKLKQKYSTGKDFCLLNRGVNGCENGFIAANYFTEASSAFLDSEFALFMLQVPAEYRKNSKFYIDWMKEYHPDMCREVWTATASKPGANLLVCLLRRIRRRVLHDIFGVKHSINPFDYWYKNNRYFSNMIESTYSSNISRIRDANLYDDIEFLFSGSIYEKMMVVTLLKTVELFEIEC